MRGELPQFPQKLGLQNHTSVSYFLLCCCQQHYNQPQLSGEGVILIGRSQSLIRGAKEGAQSRNTEAGTETETFEEQKNCL